MGRVVPIKDIRTFISAVKIIVDRAGAPRVRVSIIGPEDEDAEYARQCREMAAHAKAA